MLDGFFLVYAFSFHGVHEQIADTTTSGTGTENDELRLFQLFPCDFECGRNSGASDDRRPLNIVVKTREIFLVLFEQSAMLSVHVQNIPRKFSMYGWKMRGNFRKTPPAVADSEVFEMDHGLGELFSSFIDKVVHKPVILFSSSSCFSQAQIKRVSAQVVAVGTCHVINTPRIFLQISYNFAKSRRDFELRTDIEADR